jgi:hypothetical protein
MNFACDRCGRRFITSEEAVPGRTYRIPCDCGNTIVLEIADPAQGPPPSSARHPYTTPPGMYRSTRGDPDPFAPPVESAPAADDPFAPASSQGAGAGVPPAPLPEVTPTLAGPLARRDPDAPSEESGEYRVTGSVSFDDVLRRVRRQGFLAGSAAGALAGAVVAGVLAALTATTTVPTRESVAEAARPAEAAPGAAAAAAPGSPAAGAAPPASAVPAGPKPVAAAGPRRVAEAPPPPPERPARVPQAVARASGGLGAPAPAPARPEPSSAGPATEPEPTAAAEPGDPPTSSAEPETAPGPEATEPSSPGGAPAAEPADPAPAKTVAATGPVDEREVAAALRARRSALDACVAATPGDTSAARGHRFWLHLVIEPSGAVSEARVDDPEIDATPLGACLVRLAREMTFAAFEGKPVRVELALQYGDSD